MDFSDEHFAFVTMGLVSIAYACSWIIFHKILLELPLWSLCRSFRINKSTPRIHRRKSRKYILLFKWTSSWAIISPWRLEFYIVLLFGLDSIVGSLCLRCSSYVTPNQTR